VPATLSGIRDDVVISIADEPDVLDEGDDHEAIEALEGALVGADDDQAH
jgi:hypothetical protein